MARGGRYSSIPLILICIRQWEKGKYIPPDTVDYRKMSERMPRPLKSILPKQDKVTGECVFQLFRSISAGKNRPERAEKGENVCTKVILWNWQEEH